MASKFIIESATVERRITILTKSSSRTSFDPPDQIRSLNTHLSEDNLSRSIVQINWKVSKWWPLRRMRRWWTEWSPICSPGDEIPAFCLEAITKCIQMIEWSTNLWALQLQWLCRGRYLNAHASWRGSLRILCTFLVVSRPATNFT